jgi:hypothetical protein
MIFYCRNVSGDLRGRRYCRLSGNVCRYNELEGISVWYNKVGVDTCRCYSRGKRYILEVEV